MTQAALAKKLLVDRVNISYWENGTRDIKTGDLVAIARALNTTSDYLLGLERGVTPGISKVIEKHQKQRDLVNKMIEIFAKE